MLNAHNVSLLRFLNTAALEISGGYLKCLDVRNGLTAEREVVAEFSHDSDSP
jgi:drug/metabolite transporter superfamily protein YnfA